MKLIGEKSESLNQFILANYKTMKQGEREKLAKRYGVTVSAIQIRASRLEATTRKIKVLTEAESNALNEAIKTDYSTESASAIGKRFGVKKSTVQKRAANLGLVKKETGRKVKVIGNKTIHRIF